MRITYIGNAACLYEHRGYKVLSDPWLTDGAFEGSWCHSPRLQSKAEDFFDVDLIYLSHLHPDHYDEETLKKFPKTIPILILNQSPNYLLKKIKNLGFEKIIALDHEQKLFGPIEITMYAPFTGHLFHETELGNLIDSAIVLEADGIKILNGNDNAPDLKAAKRLYERHGAFDLVQLVDSCAGPYPACFTNLSHEEKLSERDRILRRHLNLMIECAKEMKAKRMMPFAGHYQLQGRLSALNPYLAVFSPETVAEWIEAAGVKSLLLKERESFDFDIRYPYELLPEPPDMSAALLSAAFNLYNKQKELSCYPSWTVYINEGTSIKLGASSGNEIRFTMDRRLLWEILNRRSHWNNASVGCHIQMHRTPNIYDPDVETLMCFFHV